jgi:hypothetical protein
MKRLHYKDAIGHELAITAIAGCDGNLAEAVQEMTRAGYQTTEAILAVVANNKSTAVAETREQLLPALEKQHTLDLLDSSIRTTTIVNMALQRTEERLIANTIADPSKVARDIQQVHAQMTDKRLALEGRPTSITETRNLDEVVRALEGMKVATWSEGTATEVEE